MHVRDVNNILAPVGLQATYYRHLASIYGTYSICHHWFMLLYVCMVHMQHTQIMFVEDKQHMLCMQFIFNTGRAVEWA